MENINVQTQIQIHNLLPHTGTAQLRREIFDGLGSPQKRLNSKFFYDARGSELFEQITALPEYYPTRTEKSILRRIAPMLMKNIEHHDIIELGSGDCGKISLLLNAFKGDYSAVNYVPLDYSTAALKKSANSLTLKYDGLRVEAWAADFTTQLGRIPRRRPALICFFGSTLGNLEADDAATLLQHISHTMTGDDTLLLGLDMVKSETVLHKAYNDAAGITEAFNKNILRVVNNTAECNFDERRFSHHAFFNPEQQRIEMHLRAVHEHRVESPHADDHFYFRPGETIHTENSHKYDLPRIEALANDAGLHIHNLHLDGHQWFALAELRKQRA